MSSRRTFIRVGALAGIAANLPQSWKGSRGASTRSDRDGPIGKPVVVSTWEHGLAANEAAWAILSTGGRALDAVEAGVRVTESDPDSDSVGLGGLPDRDGHVTLDACIMDEYGNCGAVAFLQDIENPISVARLVMELTPHVMLVGDGALEFALANGFEQRNLLTPNAEKRWIEWMNKTDQKMVPQVNNNNHDTIGMLALDSAGNLSGACTTSGVAWKMHGRVGDSPIIGAGLYVDNDVGAACATGWGEAVIRVVGSHLVVELMRQGLHPQEACRRAVDRVILKNQGRPDIQVGFLALDRNGRAGAYSIQPGFNFAGYDDAEGNRLTDSESSQ